MPTRVGSGSVFWLRNKSTERAAKPSWLCHPPGCVHLAIKLRLFCWELPAVGARTTICPCWCSACWWLPPAVRDTASTGCQMVLISIKARIRAVPGAAFPHPPRYAGWTGRGSVHQTPPLDEGQVWTLTVDVFSPVRFKVLMAGRVRCVQGLRRISAALCVPSVCSRIVMR